MSPLYSQQFLTHFPMNLKVFGLNMFPASADIFFSIGIPLFHILCSVLSLNSVNWWIFVDSQLSVFMKLNMSQNFFSSTSCKIIMGFLLRDVVQTCFDNIPFCVSHFVTLRCDEFPDICNVSNARLP